MSIFLWINWFIFLYFTVLILVRVIYKNPIYTIHLIIFVMGLLILASHYGII